MVGGSDNGEVNLSFVQTVWRSLCRLFKYMKLLYNRSCMCWITGVFLYFPKYCNIEKITCLVIHDWEERTNTENTIMGVVCPHTLHGWWSGCRVVLEVLPLSLAGIRHLAHRCGSQRHRLSKYVVQLCQFTTSLDWLNLCWRTSGMTQLWSSSEKIYASANANCTYL